jgi:predicted porin
MKKHFIATAVAATFAVPAVAQVTVYGRLDTGYSTRTSTAADGVKSKGAAIVYSAHSTSRIGFSGAEDLGGGLKANFLIETQLGEDTNDNLVQQGNAPTTNEAFGGRGMWAGLSGGFGSIRIGTQNAFSKDYTANFSASGGSNVLGDATLASGRAATGTARGTLLDSRYQGLSYASPAFNGLTVKAMYVADKQDISTATTQKNDLTGNEIAVEFKQGQLSAAVSRGSYTVHGSAFDAETFAASRADSTLKAEQTTTMAVAAYDLGAAKLFYKYGKVEHKQDGGASNTDGQSTYHVVGAAMPVGKITAFVNYASGDYETTTGTVKHDDSGLQLGATYSLSKRTSLYAIYGKAETDISAITREKESQIAAGLVHSF